jgi:hypothetical protein
MLRAVVLLTAARCCVALWLLLCWGLFVDALLFVGGWLRTFSWCLQGH